MVIDKKPPSAGQNATEDKSNKGFARTEGKTSEQKQQELFAQARGNNQKFEQEQVGKFNTFLTNNGFELQDFGVETTSRSFKIYSQNPSKLSELKEKLGDSSVYHAPNQHNAQHVNISFQDFDRIYTNLSLKV